MPDSNQQPRRYRAIFVSDIHLGTRRAQAEAFLEFLRLTESEYLYLVGDIIDLWSMEDLHWQQSQPDVIQKLPERRARHKLFSYISATMTSRISGTL
ncbi:MAG: hypothetical protein U1E15_04365 [Hyphomicrobiales bacterium]